MEKIKFYDLTKKKAFWTNKYELHSKKNTRTKRMVYMAKTTAPSGRKTNSIIKKEVYMRNK